MTTTSASTTFTGLLARFGRDTGGAAALMFTIAAVPLIMAAGLAIDYSRAATARTKLQASLDAGALAAAGARSMTEAQRIKLAKDTFAANFTGYGTQQVSGDPTVEFTDQGVTMSFRSTLPTTFMKVAGFDTMNLSGDTSVSIPADIKAEVALVLDYSASMNDFSGSKRKYVAMREAAIKMVGDLTSDGNDKVSFGLVPFSHHVYTTLPAAHVVGAAGSDWTGCTQDRRYPHNTGVAVPTADDATKWGHPHAPAHLSDGCSGYAPRGLKVREMSKDYAGIVGQLEAMRPYAWTHISLGLEFGWHLLDPSAPFTGAASYGDAENRKFIVLLTDGRQTEPAFGPGSQRTVAWGERNLETLCANVKAAGIRLITVAFDLDDSATENRLKACASEPATDFFVAEDGAALAGAFDSIRATIGRQVYLSK